jgi:uncharacterized protein (DUF427 family)
MKIVFNNIVIGEGGDCLQVGNECYVEPAVLYAGILAKNNNKLHCPDKGYADCYDIIYQGACEHNVAWIYPHPYPRASNLKGKVGFKKSQISFLS